jgi:hypothetical protein
MSLHNRRTATAAFLFVALLTAGCGTQTTEEAKTTSPPSTPSLEQAAPAAAPTPTVQRAATNELPQEALLVRDRDTYVMVKVNGNVKVFKASGVYHAAKGNDILETVIFFDELNGSALTQENSSIKEFFDVAVEVCPQTSDEVTLPEFRIVSLGWLPPVGHYASSISGYPNEERRNDRNNHATEWQPNLPRRSTTGKELVISLSSLTLTIARLSQKGDRASLPRWQKSRRRSG